MKPGRGEKKAAAAAIERKAKFDVNDLVRISRATFEKGYKARSDEARKYFEFIAFSIGEHHACTNCAIYRVNTSMRFFYEQELAQVNKNLEEEEFIDGVTKSRRSGANIQLLISWRGYSSKFDSWILASSLTFLRDEGGAIFHGSSER
ncbi:hypothetical protein P5V15_002696 [Pogonomyrmex californicus]